MPKNTTKRKMDIDVERIAKEYDAIRKQIKALEEDQTALKETLLNAAVKAGGNIDTPLYTIKMVEQERKSWSPESLADAGVTPKQIEKAMKRTAVSFVDVRAKKVNIKAVK